MVVKFSEVLFYISVLFSFFFVCSLRFVFGLWVVSSWSLFVSGSATEIFVSVHIGGQKTCQIISVSSCFFDSHGMVLGHC